MAADNLLVDADAATKFSLEYTHRWTVKNFSNIPDQEYKYSFFDLCDKSESRWTTKLYKIKGKLITFYIYNGSVHEETNADFILTMSDSNGKVYVKRYTHRSIFKGERQLFYDNYPSQLDKTDDDVVIFTIKMKMHSPLVTVATNKTQEDADILGHVMLEKVSKDFHKIYVNGINTDITLRMKDDTLAVHKLILSARSSVFARMFQQESVKEVIIDNVVDIEDIDITAMKGLIDFIYSGKQVDYDFETAMEVYYAADKYDIQDLKQHCGCRLISNVNRENLTKVLNLADRHGDKNLEDGIFNSSMFKLPQDQTTSRKRKWPQMEED